MNGDNNVAGAELDFVVYGATGFTGKIIVEHLLERCPPSSGVRWAMAGRDGHKLAAVRDAIGPKAQHVPLLIAAANDAAALRRMVQQTRCVIATVGPFQRYGQLLLETCVALGRDYVDLCGEVPWMREMILANEAAARASGSRILFSCGFDSVPLEAGVYYLQEEAKRRLGRPMNKVKARYRVMNGTFSGGTAESFRATQAAVAQDKTVVAVLKDPYALVPGFEGPKQPSGMKVEFDPDLNQWVAPFLMAPINSRNVHRANALLGHAWGSDFVYDEMKVAGEGPVGEAAAANIAGEGAELAGENGPRAGEGPSAKAREQGAFDILFIGFEDGIERIRTFVRADQDPGYTSTSKIIVECALALRSAQELSPGIYTPVAALTKALLARLQDAAGIAFGVEKA